MISHNWGKGPSTKKALLNVHRRVLESLWTGALLTKEMADIGHWLWCSLQSKSWYLWEWRGTALITAVDNQDCLTLTGICCFSFLLQSANWRRVYSTSPYCLQTTLHSYDQPGLWKYSSLGSPLTYHLQTHLIRKSFSPTPRTLSQCVCLPNRLLAAYHFYTWLYSEQMLSKFLCTERRQGRKTGLKEGREIYLIKSMDTFHVFLLFICQITFHVIFFPVLLLYIIHIQHCTSWRYTTYWFNICIYCERITTISLVHIHHFNS